ncbi:MAG: DNA mismatch repair endonuclease MutL, partial [Verrucomicrobiota bacterium]
DNQIYPQLIAKSQHLRKPSKIISQKGAMFAQVVGPPESQLLERIQGLAGTDVAERLLKIEPYESGDIRISGYIGGFGMGRSNRSLQLSFLNGRPVEAAMLNYALREGFHTALMKGQYPITFLFLEMSPFAVDVNVHPAKKEVRFRDGNAVRDAVIEAVSQTLTREQATIPGQQVRQIATPSSEPPNSTQTESTSQPNLIPKREQNALRKDWLQPSSSSPSLDLEQAEMAKEVPTAEPSPKTGSDDDPGEEIQSSEEPISLPEPQPTVQAEDFRIIGILRKLYVLMESAEGLVLMDQHAAHERVLFEKMRKRMANEGVPTQKLLMPLTVELEPKDFDLVQQNLDAIQRLGIGAEPFGKNTLKIDSLPTFFKADDPATYMSEVIDELKKASRRMSSMRLGEDMVATTVCRYAVKANDDLRTPEVNKLLEDLLACELPYCCPHGRPTLIQMSFDELEKKFGRTV